MAKARKVSLGLAGLMLLLASLSCLAAEYLDTSVPPKANPSVWISRPFWYAVALLTGLGAYGFFTAWLSGTDKTKSSFLRMLDCLRAYLANEDPSTPNGNAHP